MFKSGKSKDPLEYEQQLSERFDKFGIDNAVVSVDEILKIKGRFFKKIQWEGIDIVKLIKKNLPYETDTILPLSEKC